ncbi:MAG: lysophospholipase [Chloroflexi bacterium]|nr:lysophospholipase [Chloroflexota bacterium]MYD16768.1 lysophospholipase [Chloroflexota bacterium]
MTFRLNPPPDQPGQPEPEDLTLRITGVQARPREQEDREPDPSQLELRLATTRGEISALLDVSEGQTGAMITCSGAMGGEHETRGPADSVYQRLADRLPAEGISTLRIHYRIAGEFEECVLDLLGACSFLSGIGAERIVLAGHSFGGAVVIKTAQILPQVQGVISLSPQLFGTRQVDEMQKPLLLIHGTADAILHHMASEDIYERANEPKRLVLVDGGGHGLAEDPELVMSEMHQFVHEHAGPR